MLILHERLKINNSACIQAPKSKLIIVMKIVVLNKLRFIENIYPFYIYFDIPSSLSFFILFAICVQENKIYTYAYFRQSNKSLYKNC